MSFELYNTILAYGDQIKLDLYYDNSIISKLKQFDNDWSKYNPRKNINRWGLSVTSFDGGLSGYPDLDSLLNYEQETGITLHNHQCTVPTLVWEECEELKRFLEPWKKWVTRCHFLRMDKGSYFPDHYDVNKHDFSYDEVFKYQAESLFEKNDLLILISSSGNSNNIKEVLKYAKSKKVKTIGFSGFNGGYLKKNCDISIHINAMNYGISEDAHHILMHVMLQYLIKLFKKSGS